MLMSRKANPSRGTVSATFRMSASRFPTRPSYSESLEFRTGPMIICNNERPWCLNVRSPPHPDTQAPRTIRLAYPAGLSMASRTVVASSARTNGLLIALTSRLSSPRCMMAFAG